ncbi:MAG: hypothetical protein Q9227_008288 [Pyrenula ochraceoflavens]
MAVWNNDPHKESDLSEQYSGLLKSIMHATAEVETLTGIPENDRVLSVEYLDNTLSSIIAWAADSRVAYSGFRSLEGTALGSQLVCLWGNVSLAVQEFMRDLKAEEALRRPQNFPSEIGELIRLLQSVTTSIGQQRIIAQRHHYSSGSEAQEKVLKRFHQDVSIGTTKPNPIPTTDDDWKGPEQAWQKKNLLSLDGGGVRTYWTLLALDHLMMTISRIERGFDENLVVGLPLDHSFSPEQYPPELEHLPKDRRYLPCHYFDYICGTSTGGIAAMMLGRLRMSTSDSLTEYGHLVEEMFGRKSRRYITKLFFGYGNKYSTSHLEDALKRLVSRRCNVSENTGSETGFSSKSGTCKTLITTSRHREGNITPYLLRSYDHSRRPREDAGSSFADSSTRQMSHRHAIFGLASPLRIWEVLRAATAAFLYFKLFEVPRRAPQDEPIHLSDGDILDNNPTMRAVQEILEVEGSGYLHSVVSIGTSCANYIRVPSPYWSKYRAFIEIFRRPEMGRDPEQTHEFLERDLAQGRQKFHYFRFNDTKGVEVGRDELHPNNHPLRPILEAAFQSWVKALNIQEQFEECAIRLVRQRRARVLDQRRWERYATVSTYRCPEVRCEDELPNRHDFRDHLKWEHDKSLLDSSRIPESCWSRWQYQSHADK